MNRKINIAAMFVMLGAASLVLSGCQSGHKALNNIYYGHYNDPNSPGQTILAFDKAHPNQVGILFVAGTLKVGEIDPVKYSKNTVTIRPNGKKMILQISGDNHTLTCAACDGIKLSKTYAIGMQNGKPFDSKMGGIAFNQIAKEAKANGMYMPKG